jgi:biopolymer transport protein TolQ
MDAVQVYLATVGQVDEHAQPGVLELVTEADLVVQLVLVILVFMSVACWVIVLNKWMVLRTAEKRSQEFLDAFWKARRLDHVYDKVARYRGSPVAMVFKHGYLELSRLTGGDRGETGETGLLGGEDNLARALRKSASVERTALERRITFLATTGSTAPFIGLLGTVWGILRAFQKIGATGQATIATVGPDIAHALIATAMGLATAIPAVMAFNAFNRRIRVIVAEMDNFSDDFLNIVKRHFRSR